MKLPIHNFIANVYCPDHISKLNTDKVFGINEGLSVILSRQTATIVEYLWTSGLFDKIIRDKTLCNNNISTFKYIYIIIAIWIIPHNEKIRNLYLNSKIKILSLLVGSENAAYNILAAFNEEILIAIGESDNSNGINYDLLEEKLNNIIQKY